MLKVFEEQLMRKNETRSVDECANSDDEKTQADLNRCLARAERDVFIVVDALDQLDKDDQRHFVNGLDALFREHQKSANKCHLAVAISSRESFNYEKLKPHGLKPIRVKHDDNAKDIHLYLEKYLDSDLFQQDRRLKAKVRDALENQADGIFLWAKLQTVRFCNMHYKSAVRPALTELTPPKEMDRIYEFYVKDFESPDRDLKERQITTRTMALLAHTTGSMPLKVLLEALSLDTTTGRPNKDFRHELYKDPTKIIQSCNSLIDINNKLGSVRFCHRSAFDFFTRHKSADTHKLIAELCLVHLCSPDFTVGPCDNAKWYDYSSLEPLLLKHPFLEFASCNWASSTMKSFDATARGTIKETHASLLKCFKKLFETSRAKQKRRSKKNQNLQLSFQVYLMTLGKSLPPGIHLEHIISYFSLHEFLDYFVKKRLLDLKKRDDEGSTVFHWAIRNRTEQDKKDSEAAHMVKALLKHLKDPNAHDNEGRTPLHYASHHGRLHLVRLLIQRGADLDRKSNERETALIAACREHHEDVVSELLEAGADVEVQSFFGTALQAVSLIGCDRCVKSILTKYKTQTKPIEESKGPFGTSLHAAAFHGHLSVKEGKTRNRLNIHATNETYGSVLTAAATGCSVTMDPAPFEKIIETLIDHGLDVNNGTGRYGPALRAAASNGHLSLVELLCQRGASISSAEGPMGTAHQAAEEGGYKQIMKFLQERDPRAAQYNTVTPLEGKQEFTIITVNRNLFESAVSECNMAVIKRIIRFAEGFFEFWMKSGKTPILEAMTLVCKEIFEFVVILATTENAKAELETRRLTAPDADTRPRLSISSLATAQRQYRPRPSLASNRGSFVVKITRRSPTAESTPRRSSLGRDDLEGHYREVLNQLTRAAVKILENAIWQHVDSVINLLANSWVEALNNFIVMSREEMLQKVLIARTEELKGHLINPKYTQKKRIKKAEGLARVGVELLMTSIRRGAQYKRLSDILAKLWVPAVVAVDDIGTEGEEIVSKFVSMFAEWFSRAAQARDQKNAETYAQGGFQLLREAALSRQKGLMDKLVDEWVRQWKLAIDYKMGDVITDLVQDGLEEYKKCVSEEMHVEALGLAVGGIGLLRAAVKQGIGEVAYSFLPQVVSAFKWALERPTFQAAPEPDVGGEHVEAITEAVIRLIHTAEKHDPDRAATLALVILDWFESIPPENQQALSSLVHQGIQYGRKGAYGQDREVELARIATTIIYLLNKQLCSGKLRPNTLAVLESLAHSMPGITERSGFSRYEEAIAFLRLPNGKDDMAKVRDGTVEDQNDDVDEGQKWRQKEEHDQEERLKERQERRPDGEQEDEQNHKQEKKEGETSNHEKEDRQEDEQRPKQMGRQGDQEEGKREENQVGKEEKEEEDKLEDKLEEKQKTLQDEKQEAWNVGAICLSLFVNVLYLYQYIY
ncbi:hypothetical protein BC567DRAFT_154647 [Phyllosticta citribraziliensis]